MTDLEGRTGDKTFPDDELPRSWLLQEQARADRAYKLKPTDFIPLVGFVRYSLRTDSLEEGTASECPTHSFWKGLKGAAILATYHFSLCGGVWYLLK